MSKDPHFEREKQKYENPVASREHLLSILKTAKTSLSFLDICQAADAKDEMSRVGIQRRLRAMEREGQIKFTKQKKYDVQQQSELVQGRVIGHRDGYGFLKHSLTEKDYFIPVHQMNALLHDDIVEGTTAGQDRRGRTEFRVNRVIEPRKEPIVGRFYTEYGTGIVIPDDNRICHEIIIPADADMNAKQGNVVVVDIVQRPRRHLNASGRIIEVLGEHMAPGMEIETALRTFDIPHTWPKSVLSAIEQLSEEVPEEAKQGRRDLRELPLVTIDGEDARDFDDAVYCQANAQGGYTLWVAIADVSTYVRPGKALDTEAIKRGNSVYFPENVIPMLPEVLSNGLCSLNPDVDRLCMVCEMQITESGKIDTFSFYEALMRSHARLTYTKVWDLLNGDETLRERYRSLVQDLEDLNNLYKVLRRARSQRGAIEFETNETKFVFNAERKIEHIMPLVRNDAHKIIEECMIAANVCAAHFLEENNAEALFRVHDSPDDDRLSTFKQYLREIGVEHGLREEPQPREFTQVIEQTKHRLDHELIQTMLLRSMKQAVYDGENIGHFGLALHAYAHFTSPIRRYPDLVVHRAIKAILNAKADKKVTTGAKAYTVDEVEQLGEQCSMTERRADDATRDVADWLKCEFMLQHVGEVFEGVVASVTNFGLFVRLSEYHIDGLIHITSLAKDYYHYDEVKQCLIGEATALSYRLGDPLEVRVAAVNLDERKIDLVLKDLPKGALNKKKKRTISTGSLVESSKDSGEKVKKHPDKANRKAKTRSRKKAGPSSKRNKASRNKSGKRR
ncbi:ribonuclease R [Agaribacter flavus]|uniref:Ribonuclease R n=1 Tax=Agaribacter flavus TaxID=1902781 RepID=A0ABV7FRD2_9ALTE